MEIKLQIMETACCLSLFTSLSNLTSLSSYFFSASSAALCLNISFSSFNFLLFIIISSLPVSLNLLKAETDRQKGRQADRERTKNGIPHPINT